MNPASRSSYIYDYIIFYSAGEVLYNLLEGTVTISLKIILWTSSIPRSGGVLNGKVVGNT